MWGPWENSPEVRNCLISNGVHFVSRRRCDGRREDSSTRHKEAITRAQSRRRKAFKHWENPQHIESLMPLV